MKIAVLNGPNLNLLGTREPEVYGRQSLKDIERLVRALAKELGATIEFAQFNGEGEMIDQLHAWRGVVGGALVNAGAYSHSSLALRDALVGTSIPFVEVHLSNIYAREPERRHSVLSGAAVGVVCGFGATSYELGLRAIVAHLAKNA